VSLPANDTFSGAEYQPAELGCLEAVAVAVGLVESYLSVNSPEPAFPALSRHVPGTDVEAASGPAKVFAASQFFTPDVASAPAKLTDNAWLYQPFASAGRPGAAVTAGAVASYLSADDPAALVFPARSTQEPETEAVALSGPA
jgi:hypothetical protein